jgi:hypothetical protein
VLWVAVAAGAASATAWARDDQVAAHGAAQVPLTDAAHASTDARAKGAGFAAPRHVIAGGGGTSSSGVFAITGTMGQADADPLQPSTGGVFAITGGFWPGTIPPAPVGDTVFVDGFEPGVP